MNCRHCGRLTFIGNAHSCCARWMGRHGHPRCLACDAAKAFKRRDVSPTATQIDDGPEAERIDWQAMSIQQQFPWTRVHAVGPPRFNPKEVA